MKRKHSAIILLCLLVIGSGCATYYQKTQRFQSYLTEGRLDDALKWLNKNDKESTGKNELLYYMYRGWVNWMLGDAGASNADLQKADLLIEDHRKKWGAEAISLISNPSVRPYQAEDHEKVMVNYFKALNYMQLGDHEAAIVEARRITIKLQQLNDKYKERKNRYSDDAFAHTVIGMLYEANRDYNNAFIAYRNALETYEDVYAVNFGISAPIQLKKDLLRAAYLTGFYDEVTHYEEKFGFEHQPEQTEGGEMVFIWHNGLGPVKSEWSINFMTVPGGNGFVNYTNEEYGLTFPFFIGNRPAEEQSRIRDLSMLRVAFPKYLERRPAFSHAAVKAGGRSYSLELAENLNDIAYKTLHDRMLREMGNALLRVAAKKSLEMAVGAITKPRSPEEGLDIGGLAQASVSIVNALTEKADTRNWQTLPYAIYYTRIKLPAGQHTIELNTSGKGHSDRHTITVDIRKDNTTFYVFQSLESSPPGQ
jgi:hypothetical protein